jgi:hypothetical protein
LSTISCRSSARGAGFFLTFMLALSSPLRAVPENSSSEDTARIRAREEVASQVRRERQERAKAAAKKKALERQKEIELTKAKAKAIARARAAAQLRGKARGKKDATKIEQETATVTALPLFIAYDPPTIGIGGPCPGDNEISRGECALAVRHIDVARENFLDAWNTQRSPFAAMRLGDLAWLEGETTTALQWFDQVNGSTMMQRMANLRRCELEPGCGVTGRNVPSVETFNGPFGDEALLRTARIYARSGFPDLAAALLVQSDGRGCDLALSTCQRIAALALEQSTTTETLALSLAMRRRDDAHDEARAIAARHLGFPYLADDLDSTARGEIPEPRVVLKGKAAAAALAAAKAARAPPTIAQGAADKGAADKDAADKDAADKGAADKGAADKGAADKGAADKDAAKKEEDPRIVAARKAYAQKTKRDLIDDGVKRADESLEKTRRLLELAGGALPLGGPR